MREEKDTQENWDADVIEADEPQMDEERSDETRGTVSEEFAPLFEDSEAVEFRTRWLEIQSRFVDDPSVAVKDADELVANVIKSITSSFADNRISLENQWKTGDKLSTEDLRLALQHYRSFFNRLLSLES